MRRRSSARSRRPSLSSTARRCVQATVPSDLELGGYGGDIAHVPNAAGGCFAVSCVRTNQVAYWDLQGRWFGGIATAAPCALAQSRGVLIVASEAGSLMQLETSAANPSPHWLASMKWDNHIVTS